MPELPEIALFQKYIDSIALHKKVTHLSFPDESLLQAPKNALEKALIGHELEETKRLGKYLLIKSSGGKWLVFHFGMTGNLEYYQKREEPKYTKMLLSFGNGSHLAYTCRRKLGKIYLAESVEDFRKENALGTDALDLSEKQFLDLLAEKGGSIKGALTDQHLLAGIGNVYSDEMLYQCKIHPRSKVEKLADAQKKELYKQMNKILKLAIDREGERSKFPSTYLINHRRKGEECPICSGKIEQIKISGRSTYFCPSCQKEEK